MSIKLILAAVTLFATLSLPASAQPESTELCTQCTDNCPRTDPYCGVLGTQFCGLWDSEGSEWMMGTVQLFQCMNCPGTDPECHPYKARPANAPAHFVTHCTRCETGCPALDPECGRPGRQYCGLANTKSNKWVEGTVRAQQCR